MDVYELVKKSYLEAQGLRLKGESSRILNSNRSKAWVEVLANNLQVLNPDAVVFSKGNDKNRSEFGVNEFMYDVAVCEKGRVPAFKQNKELSYLRRAIWLVESELAKDSRQALIDFNKLVIGSAENKLFIGSLVDPIDLFLKVLTPAASCCGGNIYCALIPHPSAWPTVEKEPAVFQFIQSSHEWVSILC